MTSRPGPAGSWPVPVDGAAFPGILPNRTRIIIVYPTVDPQIVVIPIVSSIFVFPLIVLLIICWLRRMAAKRRQRARLASREEYWNERSCASIVQRSPPLSLSLGNGCSGTRFGTIDIELATTTLDVEIDRNPGIIENQSTQLNNNNPPELVGESSERPGRKREKEKVGEEGDSSLSSS